jgi:hypothetical protein
MAEDRETDRNEESEVSFRRGEDKIKRLEEDPPSRLEDWPDDEAKYRTLGGPEGAETYDEGPTANLGPSDLRHHEDGSVTIGGKKVDNPEEFKGEPIPGGPTDPDAPELPGERKKREKLERQEEQGGAGSDG